MRGRHFFRSSIATIAFLLLPFSAWAQQDAENLRRTIPQDPAGMRAFLEQQAARAFNCRGLEILPPDKHAQLLSKWKAIARSSNWTPKSKAQLEQSKTLQEFCAIIQAGGWMPEVQPIPAPPPPIEEPAPIPELVPIPLPPPPLTDADLDRLDISEPEPPSLTEAQLEQLDISEPEPTLDPLRLDELDISGETASSGETADVRIRASGTVSEQTAQNGAAIVVRIESEPITRMIRLTTTNWSFDEVIPLALGRHTITIIARSNTGERSPAIQRAFTVGLPPTTPLAAIIGAIETFREHPRVQTINQTIAAPVIAAVIVVNTAVATAATGMHVVALLRYLASLFTEPLLILFRKRRKPWGVVYDSARKTPVDLALVRLYDTASGRIVASRATDSAGRYAFLPNAGAYRIEVAHGRYVFPSTFLKHAREDGDRVDLYHGGPLEVGETGITANIPMDPKGDEVDAAHALARRRRTRLATTFAYTGPALSVISFAISPTVILAALVAVHIVMTIAFRRVARGRKPKSSGIIRDATTNAPIRNAIVRLFDTEYHKLLETQVTNRRGRYGFLVGPSAFEVTVERAGYADAKIGPFEHRRGEGAIAEDVTLTPKGK